MSDNVTATDTLGMTEGQQRLASRWTGNIIQILATRTRSFWPRSFDL